MKDQISELELSVRTANTLRINGVNTIEDVMNLTFDQVMSFPNAGRKTWREIEEVQENLSLKGLSEDRKKRLAALIEQVNFCLDTDPNLSIVAKDGRIILMERVTSRIGEGGNA